MANNKTQLQIGTHNIAFELWINKGENKIPFAFVISDYSLFSSLPLHFMASV